MKTTLLIFLLSLGLIGSGYCQSQSKLLEKAYKKKSVEMLSHFFENWSNEVHSNESTYTNDTILEAFKVFKGFYRPTALSLLGGSEWGDSIYSNSKYFVLQTELSKIQFVDRIYFNKAETDSLTVLKIKEVFKGDTTRQKHWLYRDKNGDLEEETIKWFGPNSDHSDYNNAVTVDSNLVFLPVIDYKDRKAVYLTAKYFKILNRFLGNAHYGLGVGGIMSPARSKGASKRRKEFLDKMITTYYGHWGGYWQLETYPRASSIIFDKDMKYARVEYRLVYEGGEPILEKRGDKWVIIHGERTWIE